MTVMYNILSTMNRNMHSMFIAIALLALARCQQYSCDFDQYRATYDNKDYPPDSDEYQTHRAIFESNCRMINSHNADPRVNYTLGINHLTDLTPSELPNHGATPPPEENEVRVSNVRISSTPPSELNYTEQNMTSPVQDQGTCGSCVPFAVVAMYESILMMNNHSYGISEQANLQCVNSYSVTGLQNDCIGGYAIDGLNIMAQIGGALRSKYPYSSYLYGTRSGTPTTPGICDETNRIIAGNGTAGLYNGATRLQLQNLINTYGPVTAHFDAGGSFTSYRSGLYYGCGTFTRRSSLNHLLVVTGWSDAGGYWIVKNSWGTGWGENGYARIPYDYDCGITQIPGHILFSQFYSDPERQIGVTTTTTSSTDESGGLAAWAIVLIVVGVLLLITAIVVSVVLYRRYKSKDSNTPASDQSDGEFAFYPHEKTVRPRSRSSEKTKFSKSTSSAKSSRRNQSISSRRSESKSSRMGASVSSKNLK